MSTLQIIILIYGYVFGWILIYAIERGVSKRHQFIGVIISIIILLLYSLLTPKETKRGIDYGLLTLPIITTLMLNGAGLISWKITGREFRPTWRGGKYSKAKKNWIDYILTFILVNISIWWPIIIAILIKRQ